MNFNPSFLLIAFGWLAASCTYALLHWFDARAERSFRIHAARNRVHVYGPVLRFVTPLAITA